MVDSIKVENLFPIGTGMSGNAREEILAAAKLVIKRTDMQV